MSNIVRAAGLARRLAAVRAMDRYKTDTYSLATECFTTYDPKDQTGNRLRKPWFHSEYHKKIWDEAESGELDKIWQLKSKQSFGSWEASGYGVAHGITRKGFHTYMQSRTDDVSFELLNRVAYILRNMIGPMEGALIEGQDWEMADDTITLKTVLGENVESKFVALPSGATKWRAWGASLAIVDEIAFHQEQRKTIETSMSATEGGGLVWYVSSGSFGSQFNVECQARIDSALQAEALSGVGLGHELQP